MPSGCSRRRGRRSPPTATCSTTTSAPRSTRSSASSRPSRRRRSSTRSTRRSKALADGHRGLRRRAHEPRHPPRAGRPPRRGRLTAERRLTSNAEDSCLRSSSCRIAEYCPHGAEIDADAGRVDLRGAARARHRDRARLRDELRLHDLPRRRARGLRLAGEPDEARKTCSTAPGASSRRRGCRARRCACRRGPDRRDSEVLDQSRQGRSTDRSIAMKWTDTQDIAMALTDAHQDVDPQYRAFHGPAPLGAGAGRVRRRPVERRTRRFSRRSRRRGSRTRITDPAGARRAVELAAQHNAKRRFREGIAVLLFSAPKRYRIAGSARDQRAVLHATCWPCWNGGAWRYVKYTRLAAFHAHAHRIVGLAARCAFPPRCRRDRRRARRAASSRCGRCRCRTDCRRHRPRPRRRPRRYPVPWPSRRTAVIASTVPQVEQ